MKRLAILQLPKNSQFKGFSFSNGSVYCPYNVFVDDARPMKTKTKASQVEVDFNVAKILCFSSHEEVERAPNKDLKPELRLGSAKPEPH